MTSAMIGLFHFPIASKVTVNNLFLCTSKCLFINLLMSALFQVGINFHLQIQKRIKKYKCNENYFEFTLRSKDSSFRSFLISGIAICFIASKGEGVRPPQVRHQDNRYQLRLCRAKWNKSSPLGKTIRGTS